MFTDIYGEVISFKMLPERPPILNVMKKLKEKRKPFVSRERWPQKDGVQANVLEVWEIAGCVSPFGSVSMKLVVVIWWYSEEI